MVITNSLRPIVRGDNHIKFHLRTEDWPQDIPLPEGAVSVELDGKSLWPYQVIYLESDKTVETVNGWFILPLSPEQTFEWYQSEMAKRGYAQVEGCHALPSWAILRYIHAGTDVRVRISIRHNLHLDQTRVMIQRTVMQPWSSGPEDEKVQPVQTSSPQLNDSDVKWRARAPRKKSHRQAKPRRVAA